jgi:hypothetical protein
MVLVKVKHFYITIYSTLVGSRKKFRFTEYFVTPAFVKTTFHCTLKHVTGLHFHVVGEGVVRLRSQRQERVYDRENYIDFRMRLLGEPGEFIYTILFL